MFSYASPDVRARMSMSNIPYEKCYSLGREGYKFVRLWGRNL
jgi:hypothetical protein